ncbi:hypothetical protein EBI01_03910 [Marinomonas rhizomae]|uniref:Tetratricopeptide repeat protein n=1 Tax=Marinomonas rhizomae TaxID=491948 RepID=A0A366JFS6_9GAMM|nr:hypothetical protein [Marinomonas rhizomae]RBP84718.1 hypothetical protein DFP80_103191 [Marinomonas rhizomae]RNF75083.1 hypothetical protein EBI01_03910 [Marinomonas rhizomae]
MKNKSIALKDMVKELGYENIDSLSNQIRDILKDKEDFKKRYVIDESMDVRSRQERFLVSNDAETLVDNIAIIQQYSNLFGKAPEGEKWKLPYYHQLKNGVDEKSFKKNIHKQMDKLNSNLNRTKRSLKSLPIFSNTVLNNPKLDIRDTSIRELMEKDLGSDNLIDFGKVYELTTWNELLDLQEKVAEGETTSLNYQLIGDKLMSLGDIEQSIVALEESVELDSENGVAWALLSHIYYQILAKHLNEHHKALARTEFIGFIENPINSEEYWINERVEDTFNDVSKLREQFVNVAIKALRYWPSWEGLPIRLDDGTEKPNYYHSLQQSGGTSLELKRSDLFLIFLNQINEQDFLQNRDQYIEILRSFQHWNIDLYPLTNIHFFPLDFYGPLIRYISWVNKGEVANVIKKLAKQLECYSHSADKSIMFLQNPFVSQMFWKHLGRKEYTNLLMSLEGMVCKNICNSRIETLATLQLEEILNCFKDLSKLLQEEWFTCHKLLDVSENREISGVSSEAVKSQLDVSSHSSLKLIDSWKSYLDDALYTKNVHAPGDRHVLIFMASFIEVYHNLNINENSEIMMLFVNNKQYFSYVRARLDERVISLFFNYILDKKQFFETNLYDATQKLILLDQELAMEDLEFY